MTTAKTGVVTGVTGQDGAYLVRLRERRYIVHGVKRSSSSYSTSRIEDPY